MLRPGFPKREQGIFRKQDLLLDPLTLRLLQCRAAILLLVGVFVLLCVVLRLVVIIPARVCKRH